MQFREVQGQGWELFPRKRCEPDEQRIRPTCFVLEINPRAPGLVESLLSIRAYGRFCLFKPRSLQLMGEFQVLTTLVFKSWFPCVMRTDSKHSLGHMPIRLVATPRRGPINITQRPFSFRLPEAVDALHQMPLSCSFPVILNSCRT